MQIEECIYFKHFNFAQRINENCEKQCVQINYIWNIYISCHFYLLIERSSVQFDYAEYLMLYSRFLFLVVNKH